MEIERQILEGCDLISLYVCRDVCTRFEGMYWDILRATRDRILRYFLRAGAERFLKILYDAHAVVTGNAALAFMLRDEGILGKELDIAVPNGGGTAIENFLVKTFDAVCLAEYPGALRRRAPYEKLFCIGRRRYVRLIISRQDSALEAVAHYDTTALMNYFNCDSFGCAFPTLTFRRRALTAPWRTLRDRDHIGQFRLIHLHRAGGFVFCTVPGPLFGGTMAVYRNYGQETLYYRCLRGENACPEQGRFFGDGSSFVSFFHGDDPEAVARVEATGQAPFGPTAKWRLDWCPYWCESRCVREERLIPRGHKTAIFLAEERDIIHGVGFVVRELLVDPNAVGT